MRPAVVGVALAIAVAIASPAPARADDHRLVVDRAVLEPAAFGGYRLRVAFSAVALGGQLVDLDGAGAVRVSVAGRVLDAPLALGRFASQRVPVDVAIVVETAGAYRDVLPAIADAVDGELLAGLAPGTRVAVVGDGAAVAATALGSVRAARTRLAALAAEAAADDRDGDAAPVLADAIDRAVAIVAAAPAFDRRLVIVIGDGRDAAQDDARLAATATVAGAAALRIHALGYAPTDARSPLRALGELAKRSRGTFRWVRSGAAESWQAALAQLRDEIARQYVATWFVADAGAAGQPLTVATTGRVAMTSNAVVVAAPPPVAPDVAGKLDPRVGVFAGMPLVALALALALAFVARRLRRR